MGFYSYRFEAVDIDGNVDRKGGAMSFDSDQPLAHLVRGAKVRLQMQQLPHNTWSYYWVVRVRIEPEVKSYTVTKQRIFVQVRAVDEEE
jgi:hypothetical protein